MKSALKRKLWGDIADSHVRHLIASDGFGNPKVERIPFQPYSLGGWNAICLLDDGELYQIWERKGPMEFESWHALAENGLVYHLSPFEALCILETVARVRDRGNN